MELSGVRTRTDLRSFLISARSFIMAEASVIASCVAFDDFLYLAGRKKSSLSSSLSSEFKRMGYLFPFLFALDLWISSSFTANIFQLPVFKI